jgi:hypothetical protein
MPFTWTCQGVHRADVEESEHPEYLHYPLMSLNTAAGVPVSASLAEWITKDLDTWRNRQALAAEPQPENGSAGIGTHEQASSEHPLCHSCLAWLQAQLLSVLDDVLLQQQPC